jgi:PleD family two-component response regulator
MKTRCQCTGTKRTEIIEIQAKKLVFMAVVVEDDAMQFAPIMMMMMMIGYRVVVIVSQSAFCAVPSYSPPLLLN